MSSERLTAFKTSVAEFFREHGWKFPVLVLVLIFAIGWVFFKKDFSADEAKTSDPAPKVPVTNAVPAAVEAPAPAPVAVSAEQQIADLKAQVAALQANKVEELRAKMTNSYAVIEGIRNTRTMKSAVWAKYPQVMDHVELPFVNTDGTGLIVRPKGDDGVVLPPDLANWDEDNYEKIILTEEHLKPVPEGSQKGKNFKLVVANGNVYGRIKKAK